MYFFPGSFRGHVKVLHRYFHSIDKRKKNQDPSTCAALSAYSLIWLHVLTHLCVTNEVNAAGVQAHMHTAEQVRVTRMPTGDYSCFSFYHPLLPQGAQRVCVCV